MSAGRIVSFWQHQPLHENLSITAHLRQNDVALVFGLDEAIERVMGQCAELYSSAHIVHLDCQRWVAYSALEYNL